MLQVLNLTKSYQGTAVNNRLSFTVEPGEIAMLAGPNGAGKTTAMKCIAGLNRYEGDIRVCGYPNRSRGAKRSLGYVPELPAPFPLLTVEEHMEFIARAYRIHGWRPRALTLLERMELTGQQGRLGGELSKGMQQKLSLCCALLPQPRVLLLDEPFVGLDPHAIRELRALLTELRDGGASLLVSTHMLGTMHGLWDKALILLSGRIAAVRMRAELESAGKSLENLFFAITEDGV